VTGVQTCALPISPRFNKSDSYNRILIELRPLLPEVYIANGDIKLAQHKASEAIVLYKKALYLENTALTNVLIAKIYSLGKNYFEAKNYYESAIKLDSAFAPAYSGLGDVYYKSDKLILAKINYAHFLKLTGNNIPAKINYVKALYKANDYDATIKNAEDILKADSTKTYLLRITAYSLVDKKNPEMSNALFYIQKFFSKTPEEELIARDYIYYSKILLGLKRDSNDIQNGIEMLEKAYITEPSDKELLVDLIKASYYNKLYNIEIKYLLKKINDGDKNTNIYSLLGKAYYYNKEYSKADSVFSIITGIDSLNFEAWQWRANAMLSKDPDLKEGLAKPDFEKILAISDKDESKCLKERYEAYSYLGSYYMFSTNVDYDKAIDYIKKSIDLKINDPQKELKAYYALGFAFYKSKQWVNAKVAYETVLKLNPEDVYAPKALNDINKYLSSK
jgi:tetratricopeptide (TPR) repeat protein